MRTKSFIAVIYFLGLAMVGNNHSVSSSISVNNKTVPLIDTATPIHFLSDEPSKTHTLNTTSTIQVTLSATPMVTSSPIALPHLFVVIPNFTGGGLYLFEPPAPLIKIGENTTVAESERQTPSGDRILHFYRISYMLFSRLSACIGKP